MAGKNKKPNHKNYSASGQPIEWRCNVIGLLQEMVLNNEKMGIFKQPVNILGHILHELAERAIELDDVKLNQIMIRLNLFEGSLPHEPGFDKKSEYLKR